jgi:acyl carrier protein
MPTKDTLSVVQEIMEDVFDVDNLEVTPKTTADDIEEWDSLSHIRLFVAIERRFKIEFKNSEVGNLKNVGDLISLIDAKLAG